MTIPTLTPMPTAPTRDDADTFNSRADAFLTALVGFTTELNATLAAINALAPDISGAAQSAAEAAASANLAALVIAGATGTSATSLAISLGSKTLTVETGKSFVPGMTVKIAYTADATCWMLGDITAYSPVTGLLTVAVHTIQKSGSFSAWTISLAAAQQGSESWLPINDDYTVPSGINTYLDCDTSGGAFTVTAPADPVDGAMFTVHDVAGTWKPGGGLNLTITDQEGNSIGGAAEDFVCNLPNATLLFRYNAARADWRIQWS